jgi:hypothetical protein
MIKVYGIHTAIPVKFGSGKLLESTAAGGSRKYAPTAYCLGIL